MRTHRDVIYNQPSNSTFSSKIESVQYNAELAITVAIRGSSRKKLQALDKTFMLTLQSSLK